VTGVLTTTDAGSSSGESAETPLDSDVSVSDDGPDAALLVILAVAVLLASGVVA